MKKKLVIVICLILLIQPATIAMASQSNNLHNDLQYIEGKLDEIQNEKDEQEEVVEGLLGEADSLKGDVEVKEGELKKLTESLNNIISYIEEVQESISKAEDELNKREEEAAERLRVMYENSNKSIFDLFLESGNITEFFQKLQIYRMVAEKDQEIIDELDIARNELNVKKSMLDGDYTSLAASINETKANLTNLKLTRSQLLQQVSTAQEKIRSLASQEEQLEQESRNLTNKLKNLQSGSKFVGGTFTWPLPADHTVHSNFGWRLHPIYGYYKMHNGLDIGGPYGASIVAANSGTVFYAGYESGYGYHIVVDHGGGYSTLYAHSSKLLVKKGDYVKKGQTIAYVGSTGASTGPHLHFEVRINGDPVNPLNYFSKQ